MEIVLIFTLNSTKSLFKYLSPSYLLKEKVLKLPGSIFQPYEKLTDKKYFLIVS